MAKRENCGDLDEILKLGCDVDRITVKSMRSGSPETGKWFRISSHHVSDGVVFVAGTEYKTEHSAAASASIFRRKLGRDRVRVAARGRFVYVYFKPVEVAEAA